MKYTIDSPIPRENVSQNENNNYFDVQLFTTSSQMSTEVYIIILKKGDNDIYYPWKEVWEKAENCIERLDVCYYTDLDRSPNSY